MKTLAIAAIAAFATIASFTAISTAKAESDLFIEAPIVHQVSDGYYDDYRPIVRHHLRRKHLRHHNGFTFSYQFGDRDEFFDRRHHRRLVRPQPIIRLTQAHVNWCYDRYRSYDHRSNSFVIRHGQRAYCVSPYSY